MKASDVAIEDLRRSIDERKRRLDSAVANLARVSSERMTLGGRMEMDPWGWLLGACMVGAAIGLLVGDSGPREPFGGASAQRRF